MIIPTYNRESVILEALESVMAQSYRPLEIVVVDDGSTDTTVERIRDWWGEIRDPHLSLLVEAHSHRGAAAARNVGILRATGEFIQFLDSDDLLHSEKIQQQLTALQRHPECSVARCYHVLDRCTSTSHGSQRDYIGAVTVEGLLERPIRTGWSYLFHRSIFIDDAKRGRGLRWREDLFVFQDIALLADLSLMYSAKVVTVCAELYTYRTHLPDRIGSDIATPLGVHRRIRALNKIFGNSRVASSAWGGELCYVLWRYVYQIGSLRELLSFLTLVAKVPLRPRVRFNFAVKIIARIVGGRRGYQILRQTFLFSFHSVKVFHVLRDS